ncbi:2468_t:CDS:2 [Scutellospora calospora]|uniref:2468_t:CDS:1 n=1 Tax=Scutellospora calospora TaxID=85575 RepID=A0ACA9MKN6_9GLOM|nr:2468_t:CDS:2 [Scutellospora calospora]
MNSQQISQRSKKIVTLFLMLEAFKTNNRCLDMNVTNTTHLLMFNQTVMNTTIQFFTHLNLRTSQQRRPKTVGFWVDVFPYLTDNEGYNSFRKHFRITCATFSTIVSRLESHPAFSATASNATPVWKQIAIVLWHLANGTGIRILEQTLRVSQGSVSNFTDRFLEALLDLESDRIAWPRGARLAAIIQGFECEEIGLENKKLPNVIGAMDSSHIPIHPPSKMDLDICTILNREIKLHPEQWVPGGTYIIADLAYPLRTYLMKAFLNYDLLGHRERCFNKTLSSMRMIVENAFGILKARWRILLHKIYCTELERIVRIIHACCILHNFCIDNGDLLSFEDIEVNSELEYENQNDIENDAITAEQERIAGIHKREYLADYLMNV